jgi:anti-sigma factor ChrR (cupin superfamily)
MTCDGSDTLPEYALGLLPAGRAAAVDAHVELCADCRRELESQRRVVAAFAFWPTDILRPSPSLYARLAERIAAETGAPPSPAAGFDATAEPPWKQVAAGIEVKVLAEDAVSDRVSVLVRLAPGVEYPPHRHASLEELHLLDGELWIDDRRLRPGDYKRAEPGTADGRVFSATGCTCVLITSTRDLLV